MLKKDFLESMRDGQELSLWQLTVLTMQLSIPAIMAQLSSIVMQYIDASMVGHLGSGEAASIGLMSSSTWMMGGLCSALSVGFTVQVAHFIGAKEEDKARGIVRQGLAVYFLIYCLSLPVLQLNAMAGGMLQCSGNMKVPSMLHILMCILDVLFNSVLIFDTRTLVVFDSEITIPGAGLGVLGAALGTSLAELVSVAFMLYFCWRVLRFSVCEKRRGWHFQRNN